MTETNTSGHGHGEAPFYDDINTPVIVLVGAISAIVTLITIMFVQGLCYHWQNSQADRLLGKTDPSKLPGVQEVAAQKAELAGASTSIEEAMQKVVANYGK